MRWFLAFVATVTVTLSIAMPDNFGLARHEVTHYVADAVATTR